MADQNGNEEDPDIADVGSSDDEEDSSSEDYDDEYDDDDDEDGGVKGVIKSLYRNSVGIFSDPLKLYSDKDEHSIQIKKRAQNRAKVSKYFSVGTDILWGLSVTMVVVVFPILVVAQRDNMIKEFREQQRRQATGLTGPHM